MDVVIVVCFVVVVSLFPSRDEGAQCVQVDHRNGRESRVKEKEKKAEVKVHRQDSLPAHTTGYKEKTGTRSVVRLRPCERGLGS